MPPILLAPGASGNADSIGPYLRGLRARDLTADAVMLPKGSAERALPAWRSALSDTPGAIIGGQSFGGRVASMLAAEDPGAVAGLVLICYPLHAPGRAERWRERTDHWPRIACPVLLLSGDRDPFARIGLLQEAVAKLPRAELHVYPGLGHGLRAVADDVLERIATFAWSLAGPVHSGQ
jgi:predicted alpha/beta-hydrolase family hydrolase